MALLSVAILATACGGNSASGTPTARPKASTDFTNALMFARCMRAHGVNFPDPGVSGIHLTLNLADVNTNSPAYLAAGKVCAIVPGS